MPRQRFQPVCPRSAVDRACLDELQQEGWTASTNMWPTFMCEHPDHGRMLVVALGGAKSKIPLTVFRLMDWLSTYGVPVYRWDADHGFRGILECGPVARAKRVA